jgi:hypothetical protein
MVEDACTVSGSGGDLKRFQTVVRFKKFLARIARVSASLSLRNAHSICIIEACDTNLTEQSPFREAVSRLAAQETPWMLWNCCAYRSPALDPALSQINPVHIPTYCLRSVLILYSSLRLGLSDLFMFSN